MRTFLEGFLSFMSPCMLPLLPVYLAYFASGEAGRAKTALRSVSFMLGFTLVFVALGVAAGGVGAALTEHKRVVEIVCGIIVMALALSFFGLFRLPTLGGARSVRVQGVFSAFLFGIVFSLCLSPCVGAFLAAALLEAASEGSALKGAIKLAAYSAGLGVPMIISALLVDKLKGTLAFLRARMGVVNAICGVVLMIFGLSIALPFNFNVSIEEPKVAEEQAVREEVVSTNAVKKVVEVVGKEQFKKEVLSAEGDVLVDFWASWCGPCLRMIPVMNEIASEGKVKVVKVNVDDNAELATEYGLRSIPAFKLFRSGKVVGEAVGALPRESLEKVLGIKAP